MASLENHDRITAELLEMGFSLPKIRKAILSQNTSHPTINQIVEYIYAHLDHVSDAALERELEQQTLKLSSSSVVNDPYHSNTVSSVDKTLASYAGKGLKGQSETDKLAFAERQRQKELEALERERRAKQAQLKALKDAMKREKAQQTKPAVTTRPVATPTASASSSSSSGSSSRDCVLQIRMPDGATLKHTISNYSDTTTLADVAAFVAAHMQQSDDDDDFLLMTTFPKKEFSREAFATTTLASAQLVPRGTLVVQRTKSKGLVKRGDHPVATLDPLAVLDTVQPEISEQPSFSDDEDEEMDLGKAKKSVTQVQSDTDRKLLCKTWCLSPKESDTSADVMVFRPPEYKFDHADVEHHESMSRAATKWQFTPDGSCLQTEHAVTANGVWRTKPRQEGEATTSSLSSTNQTLSVDIGRGTHLYNILVLTSDILVLQQAK